MLTVKHFTIKGSSHACQVMEGLVTKFVILWGNAKELTTFWSGAGILELERRERARDARGFQEDLEDLSNKVAPLPPLRFRSAWNICPISTRTAFVAVYAEIITETTIATSVLTIADHHSGSPA